MEYMEKDISKMEYSEFTLLLSEDVNDRFQLILDYDEFNIYMDTATGRYFYLESGENDASDFFEVERIACLTYDIMHDLQIPPDEAGIRMSELFECDMCGEMINDNNIQYLWFKKKEKI